MFVSPSASIVSILAMISSLSVTGAKRPDPAAAVFEHEHAHLVARPEHVDRRAEGLFGQVDVAELCSLADGIVHRAGNVQHQDHRQRLAWAWSCALSEITGSMSSSGVWRYPPTVNEWSPPTAISPPRVANVVLQGRHLRFGQGRRQARWRE